MLQRQAACRNHQMNSLGQSDRGASGWVVHPAHVVNPRPSRVDEGPGRNFETLTASHVANLRGAQPGALPVESLQGDIVRCGGAMKHGVQNIFERQTRVVSMS